MTLVVLAEVTARGSGSGLFLRSSASPDPHRPGFEWPSTAATQPILRPEGAPYEGLSGVVLVGETEPVNEKELAAYAAWAQTLSPVELDAHITLLEARETVAEEGLADVRWQLGMHRALADTERPD